MRPAAMTSMGRHAALFAAAAALLIGLIGSAAAQSGRGGAPAATVQPLAPALAPGVMAPTPGAFGSAGSSLVSPGGVPGLGARPASGIPSLFPAPPGAPASSPTGVGQSALVVSARFGRDQPAITGALRWRVYNDRADGGGNFRMLRESTEATPTFVLPPGSYVVHVNFGLVSAAKRVQLGGTAAREVFDLRAGGLKLKGQVGNVDIPAGQISFDIYSGSQFEPGAKQPVATGVVTGDTVIVPEGTYNLVSNYGEANAVVRSDIRVRAGKLTDVTVTHQAAIITLKLVTARGGEALANTAWSVLTPGGDVIKESIGAFPRFILAEGDYRVIARNDGKAYERDFKVSSGVDGEIEVFAR